MRKFKLYIFLVLLFLVLGCSKKASDSQLFAYSSAEADTSWVATGYNPEVPAGIEGQTPPAFKDMSNLNGRTSITAEAGSGSNTNEPAALTAENAVRKIVMSAYIRVRVENLAEADSLITALMEKHGAYASSTVIEENSRRYSIRVPSPVYKAAIDEINGMGRLLGCSENAEDVTLRYYDLEGRLATKKELLKTFQSYLGKAKNIEEILSVEKRIAELQYEIEGTGKELRNLADRVDYATIELSVLGPVALSPYRGPTLGERFRELFGNFGKFLSLTAIILVGIVIFGIPILLLLVFFFWLLFGKVGLLKKLWRKAAGEKQNP
jgi:hypothetical protein